MICVECHLDTPIVVDGVKVDACFGDLLGKVMNACCGHGDPARAYVRIKRLHGNSGSPCVDICGGEVVGYGDWVDRRKDNQYLLAENQRLRDALEDFANPQHWGMTRDYGPERVPVWIGSYRRSPVDIARAVLDGTPSAAQTLEDPTPHKEKAASSYGS